MHRYLALSVLILVASALGVRGEDPPTREELERAECQWIDTISQGFVENLDEMVHLWYVEHSMTEPPSDSDSLVPPQVADSVLVARLAALNSMIELPFNSIVRSYIDVYTRRRRGQLCIMLGLAQRYFPVFEEVLDRYALPLELRILPVIESALNPRAVSRVGATGLWQFMYTTGRQYKLKVNSYVDERRDPVASTHAAAKYLRDLYAIYGDWTLVIAAYNCGPGNVNKAIRRAGGKRDFWDIYYYLPRETRGYVPAFIGATYAMAYHQEHGVQVCPVELPLYSDTVMVREKLHLEQVAQTLNIPIQQLRDLNPQYKYDLILGDGGQGSPLRLPRRQVGEFVTRQAEIRGYKDSIYLNPRRIKEPLKVAGRYDGGSTKVVPGKGTPQKYVVQKGDVLGKIASQYHVTVSQLRTWNGIRGSRIHIGQVILIYNK